MVYTPTPGVFRKDINPWELLTNFSQGYHSKRLLDAPAIFPKKLVYGLVFCRSRGHCRPPEREGQRDWFYASFGHTSILQDGARAFSTIAVLGSVRARQDMRHLSFVKAIPSEPGAGPPVLGGIIARKLSPSPQPDDVPISKVGHSNEQSQRRDE
jgi:hypothetical protein